MLHVLEFKISLQFLDKVLKFFKTAGVIVLVIYLLITISENSYRVFERFWGGIFFFILYMIFIRIFRLIIGFGFILTQIAENSFDKNNNH